MKEKFYFNVVHNLPINVKIFMANSNKNVKFFWCFAVHIVALQWLNNPQCLPLSPNPLPLAFCTLWKVEQTTKRRKERKAWDPTSEKRKEKRLYAACLHACLFFFKVKLHWYKTQTHRDRSAKPAHYISGLVKRFFLSLFFLRFFVFLLSQCVYTAAMDICATGRK